jgi:hypothetical protein
VAPPEEPTESATDALYAAALDEFIAQRDQLARDLRSGGDRDAAASIKQLRKPSRVAWAVNQAVRRAPELFDAVVHTGAALRDAQQRALSEGAGSGLQDAVRARQTAVRALADVAVDALGSTGASARDAIEQTLNAASIDDNAAGAVREARLTEELEPPDIFSTFSTLDVGPGRPPVPARAKHPTEPTPRPKAAKPRRAAQEEPRQADRRERQQAERNERAEASAIEARREAEEAQEAHEQAQARAEELAQQARDAADAAEKARRAVRHAATAARDARRRAERAEREAQAARPAAGSDG